MDINNVTLTQSEEDEIHIKKLTSSWRNRNQAGL